MQHHLVLIFPLKVVFMLHARRWKLSAAQRADMWARWKAGQSLRAIGRALGKDHVVIQLLLARHGGIAPAARRCSRRVLTRTYFCTGGDGEAERATTMIDTQMSQA